MASDPYLAGVFLWAGSYAPRGYAFCQGQILAIAQNTALFSLLGTTFGGNGINTFGLPDLRGRVPVGTGTGPGLPAVLQGEVAGSPSVTLTQQNIPKHTHSVTLTVNAAADGRASSETPADSVLDSTPGTNTYAAQPDGTTKMNAGMVTAEIGITGGGQSVNLMNPYLGLNYIIATQGIFPPRD